LTAPRDSRYGDHVMLVSRYALQHVRQATAAVSSWSERLSDEQRSRMTSAAVRTELSRRFYLEGYWRIRETTPLILAAVETFNLRGDLDSAQFWSRHLCEEMGHDAIMHADLQRSYRSREALERALEVLAISPPSAALVGYFHWQVRHGNPHLLIVLRYFFEFFMTHDQTAGAGFERSLGRRATRTLALHRSVDRRHLKQCSGYIDRNFKEDDLAEMAWSIHFVATCLESAQMWVASKLLAASPR
jgi:hypothetical protein